MHSLSLIFMLLIGAVPAADGAERARELWLAGGSLQLCSELDAGSCRQAPPLRSDARTVAQYALDAQSIAGAIDPLLWRRPGAPSPRQVALVLGHAELRQADRPYTRGELGDLLDTICLDANLTRALPCKAGQGARNVWHAMLDDERAAVLSALEIPQLIDGKRSTERAFPPLSQVPGGVEVVQGFVDAARRHSGGARPRIAVVTASAQDSFDAVDFYLDLFEKLGAQAQWWPIDAALAAAVSAGLCSQLEALRREHLQLARRDHVYPDLAREQYQACLSPDALAAVPGQVHGVFFSGGDQWRLREALVDGQDRPNPWLQALHGAHAAGSLVVGGTSAGAAVQSGAGMVSNGSTASALEGGAFAVPPPSPGCDRAARCTHGTQEETFAWWPAGGTGLAEAGSVDTHFSERGRELRLLALMHAGNARWGFGADETSALQVFGEREDRTVAAHGERGGWVFERVRAAGDGALQARVHYLAPGASLVLRGTHASIEGPTQDVLPGPSARVPGDDALAGGAMRDAAWRLAHGEPAVRLAAAGGIVELRRSAATRAWRHGESIGASHLELRYVPASSIAIPRSGSRQEASGQ